MIDGHLLKDTPLSVFAAGRAAHIPLIIGTNSEEGSLLSLDPHTEGLFPKVSKQDLAQLAQSMAPSPPRMPRWNACSFATGTLCWSYLPVGLPRRLPRLARPRTSIVSSTC